jgi:hypothetical protein
MADVDERIGRTLPVVALHAGHTVTVERADIEKHQAYWIRCECGVQSLIGRYWLDRALARGSLTHGAIAQTGEVDAVGLMQRMEEQADD